MMKKYRKKQRHQVAEIDENLLDNAAGECEWKEEGIQCAFVEHQEKDEQVVIPGQMEEEEVSEIDQAVVDEIVMNYIGNEEKDEDSDADIPAPAFCSDLGNDDDNGDEIEISEGNEGMEEPANISSASVSEDDDMP